MEFCYQNFKPLAKRFLTSSSVTVQANMRHSFINFTYLLSAQTYILFDYTESTAVKNLKLSRSRQKYKGGSHCFKRLLCYFSFLAHFIPKSQDLICIGEQYVPKYSIKCSPQIGLAVLRGMSL